MEPGTRPRTLALVAAAALLLTATWLTVDLLQRAGDQEPLTPASTNNEDLAAGDGHDNVHGTEGPDAPLAAADLPRPDAPFDGPSDAPAMLETCRVAQDLSTCVVHLLNALLTVRGSEAAFTVLEQMAAIEPRIDARSHTLAHELGHHAYEVYGTIDAALANCSTKVFQGCFHGALQAYFVETGAMDDETMRDLCTATDPFGRYTCLHGVGHGITMALHYALEPALGRCDAFETDFDRESCYGGVFMENMVAYMDSERGRGHSGEHVHDHDFAIDPEDPLYPCNDVAGRYRTSCWLMQTSLILFLNEGDFQTTASICHSLESDYLRRTCFVSMGRDASAYALRETDRVVAWCSLAPNYGRAACIQGFVAEVLLNFADPQAGLAKCMEVPTMDKRACYEGMAREASSMLDLEGREALCAQVEEGYEPDCRKGAGLPVA